MECIKVKGRSKNPCLLFNGLTYYKRPNNGYYIGREVPIHRAVWISHNEIDNLRCLSPEEHAALHSKSSNWIRSEANRNNLDRIRDKAWSNRPLVDKVCIMCSNMYTTTMPTKSKYCSSKCRSTYHNRRGV